MYAIEIRYLSATNTKEPRLKAVLGCTGRTGNPRRTLTMTDSQLDSQLEEQLEEGESFGYMEPREMLIAQALLDKYHPDLEVASMGELPNRNQVVMCKRRVGAYDRAQIHLREAERQRSIKAWNTKTDQLITDQLRRTHEPTSNR